MQATNANGVVKGESVKKDVAIYIDYENLYISLRSTVGQNPNFDVILEKCREFGRVTVARAYADWSEFARMVTSHMFASGVEPVYVPTRKFYDARTRSQATKNSVDIHITIDIIKDVLLSKNIDIFVLVSGDRDYVPLMNQIRAAGKEVYGIGVAGCTSSELATAVDEMFYYHQLLESDEELAAEQRDIYGKLVRAVEIARARGYRATLGVIKPIMREIVVGFDERKFRNSKGVPFQRFKQLVMEADRSGFIRVATTGDGAELFLKAEEPTEVRRQQEEREAHARGTHAQRRAEAERPAVAAPAEGRSEGAAESAEPAVGGGRRRGRRGGRGRRRGRSAEGLAAGPAAVAADDAGADPAVPSAEVEDAERDAPPEGEREAEAARGSTTRRFWPPRFLAASDEDRAEDEPETASDAADDEDEGAEVSDADLTLPAEALDDLRHVMETFGDRAPSQRLLIARLKKGAATGELKGSYHEGQFLLLVRKAIEEGRLVKVSKRFSSGLRWSGAGHAADPS